MDDTNALIEQGKKLAEAASEPRPMRNGKPEYDGVAEYLIGLWDQTLSKFQGFHSPAAMLRLYGLVEMQDAQIKQLMGLLDGSEVAAKDAEIARLRKALETVLEAVDNTEWTYERSYYDLLKGGPWDFARAALDAHHE